MLHGVVLFALIAVVNVFASTEPDPRPPRETWTFWTREWSDLSLRWERDLTATFDYAARESLDAAHDEIPRLKDVLARLNLLATRAGGDRATVAEALEEILVGGLNRAAAEAGVVDRLARRPFRTVITDLIAFANDDALLKTATKNAARAWRATDLGAHDQRVVQSLAGVGALGLGAWGLSWAGPEQASVAAITGLVALTLANTVGKRILPVTSRFKFRENRVRGPMAKCENALVERKT